MTSPSDPSAHYVQAAYAAEQMTAHHLREYVRLLDAAQVPDAAPLVVYASLNRTVAMINIRVELDTPEPDLSFLS